MGVRRDVQIVSSAHIGGEIADSRGDPILFGVRDSDREIAVFEVSILIGEKFVAGATQCLGQALGVSGPLGFEDALSESCLPVHATRHRNRGHARVS